VPAIAATMAAPNAQKGALTGRAGEAAHEMPFVFTEAVPVQSSPVQDPEAVAWIFTSSSPLSAVMHPSTSLVLT
jgi:hypothetical protein